jgi:hypothetical protein
MQPPPSLPPAPPPLPPRPNTPPPELTLPAAGRRPTGAHAASGCRHSARPAAAVPGGAAVNAPGRHPQPRPPVVTTQRKPRPAPLAAERGRLAATPPHKFIPQKWHPLHLLGPSPTHPPAPFQPAAGHPQPRRQRQRRPPAAAAPPRQLQQRVCVRAAAACGQHQRAQRGGVGGADAERDEGLCTWVARGRAPAAGSAGLALQPRRAATPPLLLRMSLMPTPLLAPLSPCPSCSG